MSIIKILQYDIINVIFNQTRKTKQMLHLRKKQTVNQIIYNILLYTIKKKTHDNEQPCITYILYFNSDFDSVLNNKLLILHHFLIKHL